MGGVNMERRGRTRPCLKSKGIILKVLLALVLAVFLVQYIVLYLNYTMYKLLTSQLSLIQDDLDLQDAREGPQPLVNAPPSRRSSGRPRTEAILYSYQGVTGLPSADMLSDALQGHPRVFYIQDLTRDAMADGASKAFPEFYRDQIRRRLEQAGRCDANLLERLYAAGDYFSQANSFSKYEPAKNQPGGERSSVPRCVNSQAVVSGFASQSDTGPLLGALLEANSSVKVVHLVADPRLVTASLWLQSPSEPSGGGELISLNQDLPVIRRIAESYCTKLSQDIKLSSRRGRKSAGESVEGVGHLLIRYEDLLNRPAETVRRAFKFLEVPISDTFNNRLESILPVDISDLYKDIHLNVREITEQQCKHTMLSLGYGLTTLEPGEQRHHKGGSSAGVTLRWN